VGETAGETREYLIQQTAAAIREGAHAGGYIPDPNERPQREEAEDYILENTLSAPQGVPTSGGGGDTTRQRHIKILH